MKRIAAAAVVAAGTSLLAGCAQPMMRMTITSNKNKGGPDTFVTLATDNTYCVVTDGIGILGAKKNGKVVWHVNNGCSADQYLVFTHYQKYLTDPPDPTKLGPVVNDVVTPDPLYSAKIKAGDTDKKVKGEIGKDYVGSLDLYKYWICTSPNPIPNPLPDPLPNTIKCLDPDVDIWP